MSFFKILCALTLLFVCGNSQNSSSSSVDIKPSLKTSEKAAVAQPVPPKPTTTVPPKPTTVAQPVPPKPTTTVPPNPTTVAQPVPPKPTTTITPAKTNWLGEWKLVTNNSGVSAMHMVLMPKTKKVLIYDATVWRVSKIPLPKDKMPCPPIREKPGTFDCWSHAVFFDTETYALQPLKILTDTWCSSGGLGLDGHFVGTGGYRAGARAVRYLWACDKCDWNEEPVGLADPRWYSTQATLADGRMIVVGGRDVYSYEYIPEKGKKNAKAINFPFLFETKDVMTGRVLPPQVNFRLENNLYPFVILSPDSNVWIFANNRSILLDPKTDKIVHEFPKITGGPRNYPASAMHVLLPIKLVINNPPVVDADVLVCGGSTYDAYFWADKHYADLPWALQDCGRLTITKRNSIWTMEKMPTPRVMGDTVLLPDGQVLMVNGAKQGSSGWHCAEMPNVIPTLYNADAPPGQRFKELAKGTIPRMYHSSAILLADGKVLIAGSNTNDGYVDNIRYATEMRVEKFSPPYMDQTLWCWRPDIIWESSDNASAYNVKFNLKFKIKDVNVNKNELQVSLYSPSFTTHGVAMNQRLIFLAIVDVKFNIWPGVHNLVVMSPPQTAIAPVGYYLITIVYKGVPSYSMWFQLK